MRGLLNDSPADDGVVSIEDDGLTRGDGALGDLEDHAGAISDFWFDNRLRAGMAIADLCADADGAVWRRRQEPMCIQHGDGRA